MLDQLIRRIHNHRRTVRCLAVLAGLGSLAVLDGTCAIAALSEGTHSESAHQHEAEERQHTHDGQAGGSAPAGSAVPTLDAAVAAKYARVQFAELFVMPAGPKGLEYTTNIVARKGRPVRMTGFMVRHVNHDPAVFMLTEHPVSTMEHEYGIVDSVPPNVVHVLLPEQKDCGTTWQPYAITVYGRMELDRRAETDSRISYIRIRADHITVGDKLRLLDVMRPLAERDVNLGTHRHQH
jgi:hypothetical protein